MVEIVSSGEAEGLNYIERRAILFLFLQDLVLLFRGIKEPLLYQSFLEQNSIWDHKRRLMILLETVQLKKQVARK